MFRKKTITKTFFALKLSTIHWLPYCILWQKEIVSDAVSQNSYNLHSGCRKCHSPDQI